MMNPGNNKQARKSHEASVMFYRRMLKKTLNS